ncbi:MAG: hypothetical protein LBV18_03720 [Alistipes sp.]|nr:hypothetical protein [Alistipes sp.]
MKKLFFAAVAIAMVALTAVSCGPDDKKTPEGGKLTPDENKAKVEDVALDLAGQIDAQKFVEFVDATNRLTDIGLPEDLMGEEEPTRGAVSAIVNAAAPMFPSRMGAIAAIPAAATRVADIAASQFYGVFTYDEQTEEWTSTESTTELAFIYGFEGAEVKLSLVTSGSETEVEFDGTIIAVPAKVAAKMTMDGETLAAIAVDVTSIATDLSSGEVGTTVEIGGYSFALKAKIASDSSASLTLKNGSKTLVSINATGTETDLIPPMTDEPNFEATIGDLNVNLNVMDAVYVKGSIDDLQGLIDAEEELGYEDEEYAEAYTKLINDHVDIFMNYDNSNAAIATVEYKHFYEVEKSEDGLAEIHSSYGEYYIVFASDDSRFSLEEFFNDEDFADLKEAVEKLDKEFSDLLGIEDELDEPNNEPAGR